MGPSNDEILLTLKQFAADGERKTRQSRGQSFDDFRNDFFKSPAKGGNQTGLSGLGMMGNLGTSSYAPTGPRNRPSGNQDTQFGVPSGADPRYAGSQYRIQRQDQPPPWIDDVDMANSWYSPMEPVWPFGPPGATQPREWNYPVGYNLNYVPERLNLMGMLRGMRQSWGVLATIIETRKDQLLRLPWTIQRKDKPRATSVAVTEMRKFFRRPDGKLSYNQWAHKLLDDLFVIDAPSIYLDRMAGGGVKHAEIIDGGTIFPLIDDAGRRPGTIADVSSEGVEYLRRQPAFQQIIYGLPMINLSEDELMYPMMRPRPECPVFGFSPVEQILTEATEAIRKTFYQLEFWRAGSIPELIVTVPDQWSPRQIATFQAHFDALLSGQLSLKSKVRFLPGGMKPFDVKNADGNSLWSDRDEMLIRLACYSFSVSPTPFIKQNNRGTAQTAAQSAQEEGLYPLMSWWKDDIMDTIIQDKFGYDDIEFVFLPRPEVDLLKQAQIHQIKINTGEMTRNEARAENGEEPFPSQLGDIPTVSLGGVTMTLEQVISGEGIQNQGGSDSSERSERGKGQTVTKPKPASTAGGNKTQSVGAAPQKGPARPANATTLPPDKASPIHKLSRSELNSAADQALRNPTERQKKLGNYPKGHVWLHGFNITIENAKGSKRGEKDRFGVKWEVKMPAAYGYIRGTMGNDGDQVDVYLGKHPESEQVFVIDQDKFDERGEDKGFDEHKVFLGYKSAKKVLKDYLKSHFDGMGEDRIAAVSVLTLKQLKKWLRSGDQKQPISEQQVGEVIARRGDGTDLTKSDTVSVSTGLSHYDQTTLAALPKKRKKKKQRLGAQWKQLVLD